MDTYVRSSKMKNIRSLKYFLGIKVAYSRDVIYLSSPKFVLDLLFETDMLVCKPAKTPIVQNYRLVIFPNQVPTNKVRYQGLV